jgi:hypothetical protein
MGMSLNSLKGNNVPSFDVSSFIKIKDEEYRKAYSNNNKTSVNTKPNSKNTDLANTVANSLTDIINNSNVKEKVNGLVNTATSVSNTIQNNLKDCLNNEINAMNELKNNLDLINNFKNVLKNPEAFLENVAKSFIESKSDLMLSNINKLLNKLDKCNNPNNVLDPTLMNTTMASFAANAAGLADCTNDKYVDFLGCTNNGTFNVFGVSTGLASNIIKKSVDKVTITPNTISKLAKTKKLKTVFKASVNSKKIAKNIVKHSSKDNNSFKTGSNYVNVYGSEGIKNLKNSIEKSNKKSKKNEFMLAGAIKETLSKT